MKNILIFPMLFLAVAFAVLPSFAQSTPAAPQVQTFSLTSTAMALPNGKSTVAGTDTGFTFTPTTNFDLREDNVITPSIGSTSFSAFLGGFNYRLPVLSTKLNNVSPNLNGYRFQFYLTGSAGVDRVTDASGNTREHYAFLVGGGVQYDLTQSGSWTLGGEVRYAKFPGLASNTAIVSFGPQFHF